MTKQEAMEELKRAAEICPTTPLAEACRTLIAWAEQPHDCGTCKHAAKTMADEPCKHCNFVAGDKWEPRWNKWAD